MTFFNKKNLDFAGALASFICAVHCMAVPLILSLGLVSSGHWVHNHSFDFIVIIIGIIIASFSLVGDYKRHQSVMPLIFIVIGFSFLGISLLFEHSLYHMIWSVIGSCFVMSAHYINWKLSRKVCRVV